LLPCVRLGLLPGEFVLKNVDNNPSIGHLGIVHTLLHELYRYKAFPEKNSSNLRFRPRKGTALFDENVSSKGFAVDSERRSITNSAIAHTWKLAKIVPAFSSSAPYRELKLKMTSGNGLIVGVCGKSAETNMYPGHAGNSWGYQVINGNLMHQGGNTYLGTTLANNDRFGMLVDFDKGTLKFYKNGKSIGDMSSFTSSNLNEELFACVGVYGANDGATIMPCYSPDPDFVWYDTKEEDYVDKTSRTSKRRKRVY